MGKTKRDTAAATEASFHKHYAAVWGEERWHKSLYPALERPTKYCALVNRYAASTAFRASLTEHCPFDDLDAVEFLNLGAGDLNQTQRLLCYVRRCDEPHAMSPPLNQFPEPVLADATIDTQHVLTHWNLDAASALVVQLLGVKPGDKVLDICASPGGKSIAIAQALWPIFQQDCSEPTAPRGPNESYLRSNEYNASRYKSLAQNIKLYLPTRLIRAGLASTTHIDGTASMAARQFLIGSKGYDKVLVDAPCSSERHIIHAQKTAKGSGRMAYEMTNWRPGHSKVLAKTQLELLITGLQSARIGGTIVYATCSIEMSENDGIIEKTLAWNAKEIKKGVDWTIRVGFNGGDGDEKLERHLQERWAERTKYGWIVLPDHPAGGKWGPLFFTMLTKCSID